MLYAPVNVAGWHLPMCILCGCLVLDQEMHDKWHELVAPGVEP